MKKKTLFLWLCLLAFAFVPAWSQEPAAAKMGKIQGKVINPVGSPQTSGTVSLDNGAGEDKAIFKVDQNGEFSGDAPAGTYTLVYRNVDTPQKQRVDQIDNVKIVAGQTITQDIDMSRPDFIKKMTPEQQQALAAMKQKNASALKANEVIKRLNGDLKTVGQDIKDADAASVTAAKELGAGAAKPALTAKTEEIRTQKFTDVENLMKQDTAAKPTASILWARLGQAQNGLKQYDDAIVSFKKALDLESTSKKPSPEVQGLAQAGIGEAYARTGKVQDANDAYDAAAKLNPAQAGFYYRNETIIYFQAGNTDAQEASAEKGIAADPNDALVYYLKGQALVQKATFDTKTQKIVLPPGCQEAYEKYIQLAPDGPYANDVKGILQQAAQKVQTNFKAGKKK